MSTLQEWLAWYVPKLREAGASEADAREAVLLGADIAYVHQACYGDDNTPVNYNTCLQAHPELPGIMVSCWSKELDHEPDAYDVYVTGIDARVTEVWQTGRSIDRETVRLAIALHEVRHRVQAREPSIMQFRRAMIFNVLWGDQRALVVSVNMDEQYRHDERILRAQEASDDIIAWVCSDTEFDADVVERLFLHYNQPAWTVRELAAHVRMHAPIVLPEP